MQEARLDNRIHMAIKMKLDIKCEIITTRLNV